MKELTIVVDDQFEPVEEENDEEMTEDEDLKKDEL